MTKNIGDVGYTDDQLKDMIAKMHAVSSAFYPAACNTGCHAFIEFTGLMNEFIKICQQSLTAEVDFATSNTHSGKPLVVHTFNAAYIVEKLDCIFGPSIKSSPEVRAAFAKLVEVEKDEAEGTAPSVHFVSKSTLRKREPLPPVCGDMGAKSVTVDPNKVTCLICQTKMPKPKCAYCKKEKGDHKAKTFNCPTGRKSRVGYTSYDALRTFTSKEDAIKAYRFDMDVELLGTLRWSLNESVEHQKTLVSLSRMTVSKTMLDGFKRTLKDLEAQSAALEAFAAKIVSGELKRGA